VKWPVDANYPKPAVGLLSSGTDDGHFRTAENATKYLLARVEIGADVPRSISHQEKVVADSGSDSL
jgi:hypothetical protein